MLSVDGCTFKFLSDKYKAVVSPSPQVICFIVDPIPVLELDVHHSFVDI